MIEVLASLLVIGLFVGSILLAFYLVLLPPRLFLRDEPWLTEEQFLEAVPGKAWCRHTPAIAALSAFPTYVILCLTVHSTCSNTAPLILGFLPLFFLWIYVPVGIIELLAGVSVLVPIGGRGRGQPGYIAGPRVVRAGAFRLGVTAVVLTAMLVVAYW